MCSKDNNYIISFNGEIYNYKELKTYLHKFNVKFNTKSDTEVILKLYELKGPKMLNMLRGMFSIAIWDQKKEIFFLARDPYGIKPLYIGKLKEGFIFSSQVKPILNTKLITKEINQKLESELKNENISVTVSLPGYVRTNAHKRAGLNHLERKVPNWMWVNPEQVVKETEKASLRGKSEIIPGSVYKLVRPFLNFKPAMRAWRNLTKRS